MDQVSSALGMKTEIFVGSDYNATIEALRANKVDVALMGAFGYVLATTQAPVEAFAVTVTKASNSPDYHSIIIAKQDANDLTSLQSLRGHTFAFVDPSSTSGSLMPKSAMVDAKIDPEKDLKKVIYSGGHDASIIAVAEGKVDAASVADRIYAIACTKKLVDCSKIKVVWTSPAIPNDPLFYRKAISPEMKKKVADAFYAIHDLTFGEMGTVAKFAPATDQTYDVVRGIDWRHDGHGSACSVGAAFRGCRLARAVPDVAHTSARDTSSEGLAPLDRGELPSAARADRR